MSEQLDLFASEPPPEPKEWWWILEVRYARRFRAGWPKEAERNYWEIWKGVECVVKATDLEALDYFVEKLGPHRPGMHWMWFGRGKPYVPPKPKGKRPRAKPQKGPRPG